MGRAKARQILELWIALRGEKILNKLTIHTVTASLMAFTLSMPLPAAQVIGIATAKGSFLVNSLSVSGSATLFEGCTIETSRASSEARLLGGSKLALSPGSKATIFQHRLVVDRGTGQLDSAPGLHVRIGGFQVEPTEKGRLQFALLASNRVRVSVDGGAFAVRSAGGVLLANVTQGSSLDLDAQGESVTTKIVGKLQKVDGKYVVTDEATKTTIEIQGDNLEQFVGKRVEVSGTASGKVVAVTTISAAGGGLSTTAVIAGVVIVSGVGAGLSVGLTKGESKQTTSR